MRLITMSQFVDYVLTSGTSRLTAVERILQGVDDKSPDFYAPVRKTIVDMHTKGDDDAVLDSLLASLVDSRERIIFPKVVNGYKKFLRQGEMTWFEPPMRDYPLGSLTLRAAPELGLTIAGRPHVIKLYFRGEPIDPQRIVIVNQVLASAFCAAWPGVVFSTLDVRRARLYPYKPNSKVWTLLRAESLSISHLLEGLAS